MPTAGAAGSFLGREERVRSLPGVHAARVIHSGDHQLHGHQHDWPNLTIHLIGRGVEHFGEGSVELASHCVIWHPAGSWHANEMDSDGLETLGLMFDPAWLRRRGVNLDGPRFWLGGAASARALRLARLLSNPVLTEEQLLAATSDLLCLAHQQENAGAPAWLGQVVDALAADEAPSTASLARQLDIHPAWLARAYRSSVGEGLQDTVRRKKVERALRLLRRTDDPLSHVAGRAGFFDQAHMNRCFSQVLGRTPNSVRIRERAA